jgi:hypothetical protein
MLLGACRGNEVDVGDSLAVMLRNMEDLAVCDIVDIRVGTSSVPS